MTAARKPSAPATCNRCGSARVSQISTQSWVCAACGKTMRARKCKPATPAEHIAALEHWAMKHHDDQARYELREVAKWIADNMDAKPAIPPTLARLEKAAMKWNERWAYVQWVVPVDKALALSCRVHAAWKAKQSHDIPLYPTNILAAAQAKKRRGK